MRHAVAIVWQADLVHPSGSLEYAGMIMIVNLMHWSE